MQIVDATHRETQCTSSPVKANAKAPVLSAKPATSISTCPNVESARAPFKAKRLAVGMARSKAKCVLLLLLLEGLQDTRCKVEADRLRLLLLCLQFHPGCFSCFSCSEPFPTGEFYVFEEEPYCYRCVTALHTYILIGAEIGSHDNASTTDTTTSWRARPVSVAKTESRDLVSHCLHQTIRSLAVTTSTTLPALNLGARSFFQSTTLWSTTCRTVNSTLCRSLRQQLQEQDRTTRSAAATVAQRNARHWCNPSTTDLVIELESVACCGQTTRTMFVLHSRSSGIHCNRLSSPYIHSHTRSIPLIFSRFPGCKVASIVIVVIAKSW